jgi:hypothetical protein
MGYQDGNLKIKKRGNKWSKGKKRDCKKRIEAKREGNTDNKDDEPHSKGHLLIAKGQDL